MGAYEEESAVSLLLLRIASILHHLRNLAVADCVDLQEYSELAVLLSDQLELCLGVDILDLAAHLIDAGGQR